MQPPPNLSHYIHPSVPQVYLPHNPLYNMYWDRVFNRAYQYYLGLVPHADARIPQDSCLLSKNLAPIVYVCGMVGYAAAVPVRVIYLGGAILRLAWCDGRPLSIRFSEILQAIGGIFASIFGIICPLVGYRMDQWIYPGIDNPAAIRIRDGLENAIQAQVAQAREAAIQEAMPDAIRDNEPLAQFRRGRIEEVREEIRRTEDDLTGRMEEIARNVEAADVERRRQVDTRIAAIQAEADQHVANAQAAFAAQMEGCLRLNRKTLECLQVGAGERYINDANEIKLVRELVRRRLQSELRQPGSSWHFSNQPTRAAVAAHSDPDRFPNLFSHAPGYLGDGDRGMNGPALDLLKQTFGQGAPVVQATVAGTNREAILSAWLLLSMDQFGHQTPSPLAEFLTEVLLEVGDGFGGIYMDYAAILEYLQSHRGEENRLEGLLRIAFDQENTDPQLRLQIRRIVAQLIAAPHLLPILQRQE